MPRAGIVGLPNIGKSTLFNSLTLSNIAQVGNYPFCTIKSNSSRIPVHDPRLEKLSLFCSSDRVCRNEIEIIDIAGLIEGSHKGEGLGNQFLADIRDVNVVLHMVRCFENASEGFLAPDPLKDIHIIQSELILSDLAVVEKRLQRLKQTRKNGDGELDIVDAVYNTLNEGKLASCAIATLGSRMEQFAQITREMQLLSAKPVAYVLNLNDNNFAAQREKYERLIGENLNITCDLIIPVSVAVEHETISMTCEERMCFLSEFGIESTSAQRISRLVYHLLGLESFFTVGPKMTKAWSIPRRCTVRRAAGVIHSDFERHFKSARTMMWDKFMEYPGIKQAENAMERRLPNYILQDGEVLIVEHDANKLKK